MGEIYKHTLNNKIYVGYTRYTSNFRLKQHINVSLEEFENNYQHQGYKRGRK